MQIILILLVAISSIQALKWDNKTIITVAAVEYQPILDLSLTADERIMANTQKYIELIKSTNEKLDLIIFPEATLRNNPETAVETKINDNPCNSPKAVKFLKELSCAARNFKTYIVVNLVEKEKCKNTNTSSKNCKLYGNFYYNTDVIFDRSGKIIVRYRKYHLFVEYELDTPTLEEITFDTDFGIKFGIFTCFDILFKSPPEDLLKKNLDAIIFPTMWFSQLPFLTSLQTQQMWAHTHNMKLFSSGANNPKEGSGGTGFYSGSDGMILADILTTGGSKVYIYKYLKGESPNYNPQQPQPYQDPDILAKEMDSFHLTTDKTIRHFNSTILDVTSNDTQTEEVCYSNGTENEICCNFVIKVSNKSFQIGKSFYIYRMVAFSGVKSFAGAYNGGIEVCAILACLDYSLSSCGKRFPNYNEVFWPVIFEEVVITAKFEKSDNRTQFPNSLLSSIRPINASETIWEGKEVDVGGKVQIERIFATKVSQNRLLTFGIFGRNYNQDSPPCDNDNSVRSIGVSWYLLTVVAILTFFYNKMN